MKDIDKQPLLQLYNNSTLLKPYIISGVFLCVIFFLASSVYAKGIDGPKRTLIGYSSELSARPGETIEFMVNSQSGDSYKADLCV